MPVRNFFRFSRKCFELLQAKAAEVFIRGEAGFAGGEDAIADVVIAVYGVGVGIDGDQCAFVEGIADPAPVHIEAAGVGVEFDDDVVGDAGVDDLLMVDGIAGAAEEKTAGEVAEDGGIGVFDGADEAASWLFLRSS